MNLLPRVAIGSIQPDTDLQPMLWALNECLNQEGINVQNFSAHANYKGCCAEQDHCHNPVRILDNWLQGERGCQDFFWRSTRYADMAVVSGSYPAGIPDSNQPDNISVAGNLETLCQRLDLARIVVLDASRLGACLIPPRPDEIDAILLDRLPVHTSLTQWKIIFQALWDTPVLGYLGAGTTARRELDDHLRHSHLSRNHRQRLGRLLGNNLDMSHLLRIAADRQASPPVNASFANRPAGSLRVAVALDEAFPCHCPDTLDLFESFGASLHEFSPLRSESLPAGTDLVYIGCGRLDTMAERLAENICLKQSLQHYAAREGRIYAECDGLAYLCKQVQLPGGKQIPMAGLLPTTAHLQPQVVRPLPQETCLLQDSWFGGKGTSLRTYWNPRWLLDACTSIKPIALTDQAQPLLVYHQQVIGNLAHLDFPAHAEYLPRFFASDRTRLPTFL